MELLTPLQRRILYEIGNSRLRDEFFLTGGTALAAFYLHHRRSVDLDLSTPNPAAVALVPPMLHEIAGLLGLEITFTRTLDTFLECFLSSPGGERVQLDFAQDSPYRLEPTRAIPSWAFKSTTPPTLPVADSQRFSTGLSPRTLWTFTLSSRISCPLTGWWPSLAKNTWAWMTIGWPWLCRRLSE